MKKIVAIIMIVAGLFSANMKAQDYVNFEFSDGVAPGKLKTMMERNASMLLTAINRAESKGTDINYSGIDIDNLASQSIGMMWNNVHMRVVDDDIVEHCLQIKSRSGAVIGYQARNIAVRMLPFDDSYDGDLDQEVCINFDRTGKISDFNIALGLHQYTKLLKEGNTLEDMDRRMQILSWVEQFRNAYVQKDSLFMEGIFSDDALIITGKVVKREHSDIRVTDIKYTVQGKEQYLKKLKEMFRRKGYYVNVKFEDIKIKKHPSRANYYGVTLKQGWYSKNYNDEGIVFMVWDFTDELHPQILIRTWQPMEVNEKDIMSFKSIKLPKE